MITLGIVLLIAGFLLKISILWTLGIILLVVGAILAILGSTGRAIGGGRHHFLGAGGQVPPRHPGVVSHITKRRLRHSRTGYYTSVGKESVMPIWEWILIAAVAVVVLVAAIVAISMVSFRTKTKRLKQHYGSEYERLVSETGSAKGAVRELTTRERKVGKLDIVPLTPSALSA